MTQNTFQWLQEENLALREENTMLRTLVNDTLPLKTLVKHLSRMTKQSSVLFAASSTHNGSFSHRKQPLPLLATQETTLPVHPFLL
jgi:hypothetical protein